VFIQLIFLLADSEQVYPANTGGPLHDTVMNADVIVRVIHILEIGDMQTIMMTC
jgi:hypothetical protein